MHLESFLNDFGKIAQARQEFSNYLFNIATIIEQAESEIQSKLEVQKLVGELRTNAQTLKDGVFRLLVLGDMKRGKSTFLNALLGELVLPSDVNPCTAILTKLVYGKQSGVTVYFNDSKPPMPMTLSEFNKHYTIPPDEAKKFEEDKKLAFPDVSHAVIEYPLALLEKGVEIIDSPGLNDTEQRNEMSLGYVRDSHAILFVLSAVQQFTLGERRYFDNYMRGRGLTVFFLINMWDEIRRRLVDPDDKALLTEKEEKVREVFRNNIANELVVRGKNIYNQRVFEVSSLNALRARLGREGYSWDGSGFAAFVNVLTQFLTHDRAIAEMQLARSTARIAAQTIREKASVQISLISQSTAELKEKIKAVQPEFDTLTTIGKELNEEISKIRNKTANDIAKSFKEYFSIIDQTFEQDFTRYTPEINSLQFLRKEKREEFKDSLKQEFERYMQDKIADWSKLAENELQMAFAVLSSKAAHYAVSYAEVSSRIKATLTEKATPQQTKEELLEESPFWQRLVAGGLSAMAGDFAGAAMASSGIFNWKRIFANLGIVLGVSTVMYITMGIVLTPLGATLAGMLLGGWQLRQARQKFLETAKTELSKNLPKMTEQGSEKVYQSVYQQFTDYGMEVFKLINADIDSRKEQLNNLLKEKETHEIDISRETTRLQNLMHDVATERDKVDVAFDRLIGDQNFTK